MNGKDLLISLGNISHKYYEEAENDNFVKAQKRKTIRRPLMVAAIIALTLLLVGCAVAYANGWFADLFAARSDTPLTDGQVSFIQENEHVIMETKTIQEWNVELKSTMTDGNTGYILFGITAPSDIDLEAYDENSKADYTAPFITPGNYSMRAGHRAIVIASTGFSDEKLNFYWQENGYWEADNDGIPNTLDYIVELRCEKLYPNKEILLKEPFGSDITFQARFFDFTLEYEDPEIREAVEAKLAAQGDSLIGGEELQGLHKSEELVDGEWIFDVTFTDTTVETLQLIDQPITVDARVHHKIDNGTMFYDTTYGIEQIQITSFVLSPMGATVTYEQAEDVIGVFLEWNGNQGIFVVMKDGSEIQLNSDGTGYSWTSKVPIVLDDVDHVRLADGTQIGK
ncbi:MAG: hypothetical protein IJB59_12990 [Oscillospiraceae bacterium]|nr:hypothetical protein [Oscillospiraceae bacterium]